MPRDQPLLPLCLVALACCRGEPPPATDDTRVGTADTADTDDTRDTDDTGSPPVEGVTYRLHEQMESMAYIDWQQNESALVWVEYSFDEGVWLQTPPREEPPGAIQQPLLGMPYETTVQYKLLNDSGDGSAIVAQGTLETGLQPTILPNPVLLAADVSQQDPSVPYFLTSTNTAALDPWWIIIIDRLGRIVWAMEGSNSHVTLQPRPSMDQQDLVLDYNSFWRQFDDGADSRIDRIKIDGSLVLSVATPGLQHAFTELPDGHIAYGADTPNERLVEVTPHGELEEIWSCPDYLASIGDDPHSCSSNHLHWNADTDSFLFSFFTLETVVEIDHQSGATMRSFGHAPGSWSFDPPESEFFWQHGPHYLEDGSLLVSTRSASDGEETVVRQYSLDEENLVLHETWSFGLGEGIHSEAAGGATRLPSGNTLHHFGATPRAREITHDGAVVWDVAWEGQNIIGYMTPLQDLYSYVP